jgi:putative nucleotidyltransferase with HDIG domain
MPRGTQVSVAGSAILAAAFLAGPLAACLCALLGTTELREIRGRIPWYGTLYNHAVIVLAAFGAGAVYAMMIGAEPFGANPRTLVAAVLAGIAFLSINSLLTASATALRDGLSLRSVLQGDWFQVAASMLAFAPLAWLMAQTASAVGEWATLLYALPLATTRGAYARVVEIRDMFTQTVRSLASAVDARDKFTANHSVRVQEIAVTIGRVMRCSEAEIEALEWGGLLHDIGKIGVPDAVLLKPDRLNKDERTKMNMHPVIGAEIIGKVDHLKPELPIIRHHHEWYNGSGYPDHLVGEEIPKLARILHVADAFEAMTSARPYRMQPLTAEQAMGELRKYAGVQFDPVVLDAFARTAYVADVPDPGRPPVGKPIPLLGEVAAARAARAGRS